MQAENKNADTCNKDRSMYYIATWEMQGCFNWEQGWQGKSF
jgi:hypothetical protein